MVALTWPDFIIALILVGFGAVGFVMGLIQVVGGLAGVGAGVFLANVWHRPLGAWLSRVASLSPRLATLIAFIGILVVVQRATAMGFYVVGRVLRLLRFIPLFKSLNRLAGGLFGLLEGALLLGFIFQVAQASPVPGLDGWLRPSRLMPWLISLVEIMQGMAPWLRLPLRPPTPYDLPLVV